MKGRVLAVLLFCFLGSFSLAVFPSPAGATNIEFPSFSLYSPVKIVVTFIYTQNVTTHVGTASQSLYKAITSPTSVEFDTQALDVFTIDMNILYSLAQNQTVTIGISEGDRPTKSITVSMNDKDLSLHLIVNVVEEPTFPTADQIANAMLDRWQNQLTAFEAANSQLTNEMSSSVVVAASLGIIAFVVSVLCFGTMFWIHKRQANLEAKGLSG